RSCGCYLLVAAVNLVLSRARARSGSIRHRRSPLCRSIVLDSPGLVVVLYGLVLRGSDENDKGGSMTTIPNAQGTFGRPRLQGCSTSGNITRSLLGYLALAGPFYVVVSLVQALIRPGFSLIRDEWSLLALGHMGWIQMVNLILTGAMTVAGAI